MHFEPVALQYTRNITLAYRPRTRPEGTEKTTGNYFQMNKSIPRLGAPAAFTFSQDIGHPFAGKSYVALPDPLPELPRHQAHHLLVVLCNIKTQGTKVYLE